MGNPDTTQGECDWFAEGESYGLMIGRVDDPHVLLEEVIDHGSVVKGGIAALASERRVRRSRMLRSVVWPASA